MRGIPLDQEEIDPDLDLGAHLDQIDKGPQIATSSNPGIRIITTMKRKISEGISKKRGPSDSIPTSGSQRMIMIKGIKEINCNNNRARAIRKERTSTSLQAISKMIRCIISNHITHPQVTNLLKEDKIRATRTANEMEGRTLNPLEGFMHSAGIIAIKEKMAAIEEAEAMKEVTEMRGRIGTELTRMIGNLTGTTVKRTRRRTLPNSCRATIINKTISPRRINPTKASQIYSRMIDSPVKAVAQINLAGKTHPIKGAEPEAKESKIIPVISDRERKTL